MVLFMYLCVSANLIVFYGSDSSLQANVSWTPVTGTFDLRQYRIQVCNTSRACSNIESTTRFSMETRLSDDDISLAVNASIFVEVLLNLIVIMVTQACPMK